MPGSEEDWGAEVTSTSDQGLPRSLHFKRLLWFLGRAQSPSYRPGAPHSGSVNVLRVLPPRSHTSPLLLPLLPPPAATALI